MAGVITMPGEGDIDWANRATGELTDFEITDPDEPVYDEDDESDLDDEDDYWSGSVTNVPRPISP